MNNAVDEAYGAVPERLYVVGKNGKIFYQGGAGPHLFDVDQWEDAIRTCAEAGDESKVSESRLRTY